MRWLAVYGRDWPPKSEAFVDVDAYSGVDWDCSCISWSSDNDGEDDSGMEGAGSL